MLVLQYNCHLINNNRAVILQGSINTTISSPTITVSLHRPLKTFLMPILRDKRINFLKLLWFKIFTFVDQISAEVVEVSSASPASPGVVSWGQTDLRLEVRLEVRWAAPALIGCPCAAQPSVLQTALLSSHCVVVLSAPQPAQRRGWTWRTSPTTSWASPSGSGCLVWPGRRSRARSTNLR